MVEVISVVVGVGVAVIARLLYDGVKSKRNGNNYNSGNKGDLLNKINTKIELLTKDVSTVDTNVEELKRTLDKSNELSIEANVLLHGIQITLSQWEVQFRNLFTALLDKHRESTI